MADYIYCGTEPPVGACGTQKLLLGTYNAIWYPPPRRALSEKPATGGRVWLVWRSRATVQPVLLGGGRIRITDECNVLWTNRTLRGVRPEAQAIGYPGPSSMAFLHLCHVVSPYGRPAVNIEVITTGLNVASVEQVQILTQLLDIP